jgi:hypothetical protein
MHPLRKLRESGKPTAAQVSELLAENVVSNSPILIRPIEGREVIAAIFAQSSSTRGSGTYMGEFKLDERTTFLRWVGTMDGHKIESFEVIVDNEQGLIVERTIAMRPYPALKLFRDAMYAALKDKLPPDVWDYPRLPDHIDSGVTSFGSVTDLMSPSEAAHGEHEKPTGVRDENCDWYVAYTAAEQAETELPK